MTERIEMVVTVAVCALLSIGAYEVAERMGAAESVAYAIGVVTGGLLTPLVVAAVRAWVDIFSIRPRR